jgi:hypothetical protein
MYIDKIDDFVDKFLDDYFLNTIKKNKNLESIIKEKNFIKYQKEINELLIEYHKTINYSKIKDSLINQDNTKFFDEIIKKYMMIYVFLYIGYNYADNQETYSNNIVEFSKNQINFKFKINNFFNSETNFNIIENYRDIKNIISILEIFEDENKIKLLIKRPDYKSAFVFLNELGKDLVTDILIKEKDTKIKIHNLLKLMILLNFYKKMDKKEISTMLENTSVDGEEYTYIDIVVPTRDNIDYVTVESLLTRREIMMGYTNNFWNYIIDNQDNIAKINLLEETIENKILHLINSGILIPVLDDFLLYHKDSERYDKNMDSALLKDIKKRDETKIKYIITKIDSTSDLYSKNIKDEKARVNIKKNFFTPLNNRKAILVNNNEEVKIISKLINQGSKVMNENEYFNELANYRVYPYINFKDFKDYGFSIQLNKTVQAIREVTFEKAGDFRQKKSSPVQLRVGSKNEFVNIVGFIIPSNITPLECLKVNDFRDIHNYGKNGYDLTLSYLTEGTIKNTPHKSSIVWLFNMNTDFVKEDNYEQTSKLTEQEQIKKLMSKFYDDVLIRMYEVFSKKLDEYKEISLQKARSILEKLENRIVKINKNLKIYNDIENIIIDKAIKKEEKYDEKEDIFFGLGGEIKELPQYSKELSLEKVKRIDVSKSKEDKGMKEIEEIEGVCQHNITWESISKFKKVNVSKYQDKIYEFIQNYVIENNEGEFVCKSCSTQIDVKKYVIDGTFDDDSNKFVTFSMPFDTPLEELPEYEKYKIAIRSLDKLIEKIAIINNIPAYIGNMFNIRIKRKNISKDLIDLAIDNNHFLKKNLKERNELATKAYHVSRELSNLFVFDFENSIFLFSSKEKDYYKNIKYNNILAYIIILLCLDVNESQLSFMTGDKKGLCNISVFNKYGHVLFDNLKILKNKNGDTVPIKNYMILCYLIYLMSCMMTKYSMWYYEKEDATKKKFNPTIQKIIVHTVVDVLNSVLENSKINKAGIIFEIITTKFYLKLNTFFNNDELYKRLNYEDTHSIAGEKKSFVLPKTTLHLIQKYEPLVEFELPKFNKIINVKFIPKNRILDFKKQKNINSITNCEDGNFHKWVPNGKVFICGLCNKNLSEMDLDDEKVNNKLSENNKYISLQKLTRKYCISGNLHNFSKSKNGNEICKLCGKSNKEKYDEKELDKLNKNLMKLRIKLIQNLNDLSKIKTPDIIDKLGENYNKNVKELDKYLESFIKKIEQYLGEYERKDFNLYENTYIINHSYDGNKLDKPFILTDKDNKIILKNNHPFFKTDVLTYSFNKSGTSKIEVFYDAISKILLGYKETSRDYVINYKTENKIKVNYSLMYKLKYLGIENNYIDIYSKINRMLGIDKYEKLDNNNKEEIIHDLIYDISRDRLRNLKKVIYELQRFINQIKNKYTVQVEEKKKIQKKSYDEDEDEEEEEIVEEDLSNFEKVIDRYNKKLTEFKTSDEDNNYKIFENWNLIVDNLNTKLDLDDYKFNLNINQTSKIMEANEIIKFDNSSNLLLFYILNEISNLLDFNSNKYIKTNLTGLLLELINYNFNLFNLEMIQSNISVKRLEYILNGLVFAEDLENVISEFGTGDEEEEVGIDAKQTEEEIEEIEDAREEEEALDVDGEYDYISNYENIYEDNEYDERALAELPSYR